MLRLISLRRLPGSTRSSGGAADRRARDGEVGAIGVSNFTVAHLEALKQTAPI